MQVDVYIRDEEGKQIQYLLLPLGQIDFPEPATRKRWRKIFQMDTDAPRIDMPMTFPIADLKHKGFAIIRVESWSKDWSCLTDEEIAAFEEPEGWQDNWYLA